MLAAMSSLASLTHAAAPARPAFNGLFYATVATIIPVLFLAIAVQGRAYEGLMRAIGAIAVRAGRTGRPGRRQFAAYMITMALLPIPALILIYGAAGEIVAILALLDQWTGQVPQGFVGSAAVFLTLTTAAGPAAAFWKSMISAVRLLAPLGRQPAEAMSIPAAQHAADPGKPPAAETCKRDPA